MESIHQNLDYPCSQCERRFKNFDCWKNHVLKYHEKRLDFKCEQCGKDFATVTELNRHIRYRPGKIFVGVGHNTYLY